MSTSFHRLALTSGALSLLLACGACSKPEPPKKEQPPEPQAQAPVETAALVALLQLRFDLRPGAVHEDQLDAQRG